MHVDQSIVEKRFNTVNRAEESGLFCVLQLTVSKWHSRIKSKCTLTNNENIILYETTAFNF